MKIVLLGATALCAAAAPPSSLQFVPPPAQSTLSLNIAGVATKGVLPLNSGAVAVFGNQIVSVCIMTGYPVEICNPAQPQTQPPVLVVLNAAGVETAALPTAALGSGNSIVLAAAADSAGNIWISGQTNSDDVPLVNPLFTSKPAYNFAGFVAKLDPNLHVLFSTFLAASVTAPPPGAVISSVPFAIALDGSGNAYVAGSTNDPAFPVTASAFGPTAAGLTEAFVLGLPADGSKLLYSRLLGGKTGPCVGGSSCIGKAQYTEATAIAVDDMGNVTVAGDTYSTDFPITPNVYTTGGGAFASRVSAGGSNLVWSTEVGNSVTILGFQTSLVQSLALDSSGNVYVAGRSYAPIATTPGALQPASQLNAFGPSGGFALKLSSDATQLLFATNLSGKNGSALTGLTLDSSGDAWVTGTTTSPDFPGLNAVTSIGLDFAAELNSGATALQQIFTLIPQTVSTPPAFDSDGNLLLLASAGNLLRLNPATAYSAPAAFALTNAAIPAAAASIAPGEIMTIYGVGLGPSTGTVAVPDVNGYYPTQFDGVSIQIGGAGTNALAPLLYVGPNQINFEVTPNVPSPATLTVTTPSGSLPPMYLNVAGSIGIFGVVNPDGSPNRPSNPAKAGSMVSIFLTGLGLPTFSLRDGGISTAANPAFTFDTEVNWSGGKTPLPLFYAGTAPGEIDGVDQINVQLPATIKNPVLMVSVPSVYNSSLPATSNSVIVYAQ